MTANNDGKKHFCVWVLASGEYCRAKVAYHMHKDDDNNPYRVYDTLCAVHTQALLDQQAQQRAYREAHPEEVFDEDDDYR